MMIIHPMEFVIKLLIEVFNKNITTAKEITMEIHNNTSAIAGNYNFEIAEQKTNEAITVKCKWSSITT